MFVILSAILSWFWVMPGVSGQIASKPSTATDTSMLDEVSEDDISGAMHTMYGSPDFFAQFKARKDACPAPLAWVSLVRTPGSPAGAVRVKSGRYVSPEFELGDVPLRVAIPFPGPYEAGHGLLEVISVGGGGTVTLRPALQIAPGSTKTLKQVTWKPIRRCSKTNE